jgi:hypothetical protein
MEMMKMRIWNIRAEFARSVTGSQLLEEYALERARRCNCLISQVDEF